MSTLRRLAKDHALLRHSLPPNYLFPPTEDAESLPDDLTQLSIHLTGSEGTPYSSGLWLLHLRIPTDYPRSPPKATFKTRIFHPNVEESTGAVCLETLKRDWDPKLTLKDILVTISCLLIQPNPDSALNEKAGVLVREDYDGFIRQARLMTKIHAPIPAGLCGAVDEARRRGEDNISVSVKTRHNINATTTEEKTQRPTRSSTVVEASSSDEGTDSSKENQPSRGRKASANSSALHKHILGKRSIADVTVLSNEEGGIGLRTAEQTILDDSSQPLRKSPKHNHLSQANGRESLPPTLDVSCSVNLQAIPEVLGPLKPPQESTHNSQSRKATVTKYPTYARVGIKRL